VGGDTVDAAHTIFSPRTFNVCPSCELARPIEITVSDSSSHAKFEGGWEGRSDSSVGGIQLHDCDSGHSLNVQSTVEQQINFELPEADLSNCITIDIESTIEFWVRQRAKMMALTDDSTDTYEEKPLLTARFKNRFVVDNDTFHVKYLRTSVWLNLESPTCSFIAEKAAEKMRKATISHQEYWDVVDKHKSLEVCKKFDEAPTSLPLQKDGEAMPVPLALSSTESLTSTPILPQADAPRIAKKKNLFRFRRFSRPRSLSFFIPPADSGDVCAT
jgi:hypothetical protein